MAKLPVRIEWTEDPRPVLAGLSRAMQNKITKASIERVIPQIETNMRFAAPKDLGTMKASIGSRVKKTRKGKKVWVGVVGPRSKYSVPQMRHGRQLTRNGKPLVHKPSKYAHLVERGHRFPKKRTGSILQKIGRAIVRAFGGGGRVKPHPFIKPMFQRKRMHYLAVMTTSMREGVNAYLKRRKKTAK